MDNEKALRKVGMSCDLSLSTILYYVIVLGSGLTLSGDRSSGPLHAVCCPSQLMDDSMRREGKKRVLLVPLQNVFFFLASLSHPSAVMDDSQRTNNYPDLCTKKLTRSIVLALVLCCSLVQHRALVAFIRLLSK